MRSSPSRRPATSVLASAVVAGLLTTALPPTAHAALATAYQPYGSASLLTVGSHQYYDVYGTQARDISDPSTFLRKVLNAPVPGAGLNSLANLWGDLGRTIYFTKKTNQDSAYFAGNSNGSFSWQNSPLTEASSVAAADQQLRTAMGMPSGYLVNTDLADNTTSQSVFYQLRSASGDLGGNAGIAVIFYGFKLGYLNAGSQMASAPPGPDNKVTTGTPDVSYAGGVQNASSVPVQASQSLSQTTTQDITNSVTTTEQYSHTQAIEYTTELTTPLSGLVGGGKETIKVALNATEMFGTATSSSTTNSVSTSATGQVSMALPAHTGALISQSTTKSTFLAKYDYPVSVQYQVK
ncbi:MAG TPA: hypothetical protein PLO87_13125, partial [Ornithinibacter sp.]|nr:hypothetical protein [Ornithinibacter sp.]